MAEERVDGDALAELYRAEYRSLVRLASLLIDDVGACEEIVQDAFVKIQVRGGRLRDPDKAPAYLRSVVLNGARSRLRRRRVAEKHPEAPPGVAASAEAGVLEDAEHQRVLDALRALPRRQREAVALRFYLELSEAEMAAAMGVSAGSVKTHLHRGLQALATTLGPSGKEDS